jgi:hypothetical protein
MCISSMEKTKDPSAKYYATVVVQMGIVMYILHDCIQDALQGLCTLCRLAYLLGIKLECPILLQQPTTFTAG